MECLTSKYAAMKLLSFYIHIKYSIDDFAKRFGVSRRTINYDIVYLMDFYEIDTKPGRMEEFLL